MLPMSLLADLTTLTLLILGEFLSTDIDKTNMELHIFLDKTLIGIAVSFGDRSGDSADICFAHPAVHGLA